MLFHPKLLGTTFIIIIIYIYIYIFFFFLNIRQEWWWGYQKRGDGSKGQGLITSKVRIRKECPKQGCHVWGSIEDVNDCCGCHTLDVEHSGQVNQEVW